MGQGGSKKKKRNLQRADDKKVLPKLDHAKHGLKHTPSGVTSKKVSESFSKGKQSSITTTPSNVGNTLLESGKKSFTFKNGPQEARSSSKSGENSALCDVEIRLTRQKNSGVSTKKPFSKISKSEKASGKTTTNTAVTSQKSKNAKEADSLPSVPLTTSLKNQPSPISFPNREASLSQDLDVPSNNLNQKKSHAAPDSNGEKVPAEGANGDESHVKSTLHSSNSSQNHFPGKNNNTKIKQAASNNYSNNSKDKLPAINVKGDSDVKVSNNINNSTSKHTNTTENTEAQNVLKSARKKLTPVPFQKDELQRPNVEQLNDRPIGSKKSFKDSFIKQKSKEAEQPRALRSQSSQDGNEIIKQKSSGRTFTSLNENTTPKEAIQKREMSTTSVNGSSSSLHKLSPTTPSSPRGKKTSAPTAGKRKFPNVPSSEVRQKDTTSSHQKPSSPSSVSTSPVKPTLSIKVEHSSRLDKPSSKVFINRTSSSLMPAKPLRGRHAEGIPDRKNIKSHATRNEFPVSSRNESSSDSESVQHEKNDKVLSVPGHQHHRRRRHHHRHHHHHQSTLLKKEKTLSPESEKKEYAQGDRYMSNSRSRWPRAENISKSDGISTRSSSRFPSRSRNGSTGEVYASPTSSATLHSRHSVTSFNKPPTKPASFYDKTRSVSGTKDRRKQDKTYSHNAPRGCPPPTRPLTFCERFSCSCRLPDHATDHCPTCQLVTFDDCPLL